MRSGLKENCPLKPQLEVSFTEGSIFPLPSSPKDFHCNFPKFSLISPTILNSWIVHFLAGLIFTENILHVPGSMWELMEVGDQAFSLTFSPQATHRSSPSTSSISVPSQPPMSSGTDSPRCTGKSWASHLLCAWPRLYGEVEDNCRGGLVFAPQCSTERSGRSLGKSWHDACWGELP